MPGEPEVIEEIPFDVSPQASKPSGISHNRPLGQDLSSREEPSEPQPTEQRRPAIQTFGNALESRHEDSWSRTPNTTGTGAIHVKSFHSKLTGDSLHFLDKQINEWLDAHPQYEVKLVTTTVGTWTGKLKEPNLIVNVWV